MFSNSNHDDNLIVSMKVIEIREESFFKSHTYTFLHKDIIYRRFFLLFIYC